MIGNDLVDLSLAARESDWQRKGFLQKLFSEKEQEVILQSLDPTLVVWRFWSMKESAYKAHQRRFSLPRKFNPREFHCEILSSAKAIVEIQNCRYFVSSEIRQEFIYSEAVVENHFFDLHTSLRTGISSEAINRESLQRFAFYSGNIAEDLHIKKAENGVPFFSSENTIFDTPISFTHHGIFSAFTIAFPSDQ